LKRITLILLNKSMMILPLLGARKTFGIKEEWFGLFT
jgi:hypothetical protein